MKVGLRKLRRSFGSFCAVDDISLDYHEACLYALVGENGAGKSTLMHLLYGMLPPDSGSILIDEKPTFFRSPQDAIRLGIGMVHQHFMLVDTLTVAENVVLGSEPLARGLLDHSAARRSVLDYADRFHLDVDPDAPVSSLSVGECQRVEILKVLYRGAEFLIFDEPTGVLTPQESRFLFTILRSLRAEGKTIVLISHKLDEVMSLAEEIDVMRRGKYQGRLPHAEASPEELARRMVGREVLFTVEKTPARPGPVCLLADSLSLDATPESRPLKEVSFDVREGEILGFAGVEGNGQRELAGILSGMLPPDRGTIQVAGEVQDSLDPRTARALGIRHVPEDRQKTGLLLDMSLEENLILGEEGEAPLSTRGLFRRSRIRDVARQRIESLDVRIHDPAQSARELSGGNQQKPILSRELAHDPRILIASQPTRVVDVGAIESIHRILLERRDRGMAILLFSSELSELLALCDRIAVLYRGSLLRILDASRTDEEELGLYITGASPEVVS